MAQILIRNLDDDTIERLRARAATNGRSLEGEARRILEAGAGYSVDEARRKLANWRKTLADRPLAASQGLLNADRGR